MTERRPEPGDAAFYTELFCAPEVASVLLVESEEHALRIHATDLEEWERNGWGAWLWFDEEGFVGRGGLEPTSVGGALGVETLYALMPDRWGRGYATAIARRSVVWAWELELPDVVGFARTDNVASIRVLEKAGLVFEREIEHAGLPHWFGRVQRPV